MLEGVNSNALVHWRTGSKTAHALMSPSSVNHGVACSTKSEEIDFFDSRRFFFRFPPPRQVFTYPMEMYVARHVLDVAVFQTWLGKGPITQARHFGITIALWVLTIILSASTDNLGSILEIFGAFSASVSVFASRSGLQHHMPSELSFFARHF